MGILTGGFRQRRCLGVLHGGSQLALEYLLVRRGLTKDCIIEISLDDMAVPSTSVTILIRALLDHRTRRPPFVIAHFDTHA